MRVFRPRGNINFSTLYGAKAAGRVAKPPKPLRKAAAAFKPRRSSIVEETIRPTTLLLDPKELLAAKPGWYSFTWGTRVSFAMLNFLL